MKLHWLLFACCVGMCLVSGAAFFIDEKPLVEVTDAETGAVSLVPQGHGYAHAEFETMSVGGPGAERHEHILWLGWALGALICIFFVGCLAFGARKHEVVGAFGAPLVIGGIAYLAAWTMMFVTYRDYMHGDMEGRFLSLPIPMAWMIFGVWLVPACFILNYIFMFNKQYWSEELEEEFNGILERSRARNGEGDAS